MEFSLLSFWTHMGIPALVIAVLLLLMGLVSLTVFIERLLAIRASRAASIEFALAIGPTIQRDQLESVLSRTHGPEFEHAALALLIRNGLSAYQSAVEAGRHSALDAVEQTKRRVERHLEVLSADLRRGLGVLASVGSTAPFVGLLGTVVGIISAFQGIAATGSGGLSSVSAGISEALVETALGLAVAIPVVLGFNYLSAQIAHEEQVLSHAAGELLDNIEGWHKPSSSSADRTQHLAPERSRLQGNA